MLSALTFHRICEFTARQAGVEVSELLSRSTRRAAIEARAMMVGICRATGVATYTQIAELFGSPKCHGKFTNLHRHWLELAESYRKRTIAQAIEYIATREAA